MLAIFRYNCQRITKYHILNFIIRSASKQTGLPISTLITSIDIITTQSHYHRIISHEEEKKRGHDVKRRRVMDVERKRGKNVRKRQ